ncbi:MAG: UDP-N-acetylmuramate--L-alanine ligase [Deltaproteobacteria bacterium]|nr:UDP-N-acetylmuramate--L-alanine ligase [Deltaproteobacteria bacterium]MBW2361460.1 UDP-N-acetylmuramate--L-alanine ligase [Deltaproteobacteria bacterium]
MKRRFRGIDRVHFIGIGGVGMCGIAELLHGLGYTISGSDLAEGSTVERLRGLGIHVVTGHAETNVGAADVVVVSSAIRANNPEIAEAARRGIPVIPRAEMLAELMRLQDGIAVAGTHGKTTTTSLIAHVLEHAGLDPTAVVGGRIAGAGERTGARLGQGAFLVAEADESDGSFLRLAPVIAVITNVEPEHLDHYGTEEALQDAFVQFANRVPFFGVCVVCLDHPGVQELLPRLTRRRSTYGFSPQAEWGAGEPEFHVDGARFEVRHGEQTLGPIDLPLAGRHNVLNALAAIAVAGEAGVSFERTSEALASFPGVERRFETKGEVAGIRVIDDYGHHPTEILATLAAARGVHSGRLVVVFQPHRYSRTRDLFEDFAAAFHEADLVWVTEIYAAGETKLPGIEGESLADAVRARGHRDVRFAADLATLPDRLVPELRAGDWVLTLGAGDITRLGPRLLAALEARA